MPRPLFIIGNKRSGTSHLVRLINAHPALYVAPEADLVWALYCRARNEPITRYPDDGDKGLNETIDLCGDIFASDAAPDEAFRAALARLAIRDGKSPASLAWIGDKKPVQQADPDVFAFIRTTWPDARFLHIVRHPSAVLASKRAAIGKFTELETWKQPTDDLLAFWVENEQHVIAHRDAGAAVHSIVFPQLVRDPAGAYDRLLHFLDLPSADAELSAFVGAETVSQDEKYADADLPLSPQAQDVVARYNL
jgi:hypothetical protein